MLELLAWGAATLVEFVVFAGTPWGHWLVGLLQGERWPTSQRGFTADVGGHLCISIPDLGSVVHRITVWHIKV